MSMTPYKLMYVGCHYCLTILLIIIFNGYFNRLSTIWKVWAMGALSTHCKNTRGEEDVGFLSERAMNHGVMTKTWFDLGLEGSVVHHLAFVLTSPKTIMVYHSTWFNVSLAGASVSVAVPFVAVALAGVSPSFPGDSAINGALAEAMWAMMIALLLCVIQIDKWLLLLFALIWSFV